MMKPHDAGSLPDPTSIVKSSIHVAGFGRPDHKRDLDPLSDLAKAG